MMMSYARLKSAARLEVRAPASAAPGASLGFEVAVTNVGAGHNLPTSLTELREMWVEVTIRDAGGERLECFTRPVAAQRSVVRER